MIKNRYDSINGLRAIMCIGILVMHVFANTQSGLTGYFFENIIPSFNSFVFLFMIISGFGMCCGYYEKIKNNKITPNEFYLKRYKKILPFFALLILFDVLIERSSSSIIEGFADLTLVYGFLPNPKIQVIGVGWTIGVIFAFYILFPFFVFLLDNKKRAWFSLFISLIFNFACLYYFFGDYFVADSFRASSNILYCSIYFIIGGIIYLYKENLKIVKDNKVLYVFCLLISIIIFLLPVDIISFKWFPMIKESIVYTLWLIIAINTNGKIMNNKFTKFISDISMEIYLCHMVVFRILEKMRLIDIFNDGLLSYVTNCILVLIGAITFSIIAKKLIEKINGFISSRMSKSINV